MRTNQEDDHQKLDEVLVLMESPLYWTMTVKERLVLVQQAPLNGGEREGAGFKQRALEWIKTGIWGRLG